MKSKKELITTFQLITTLCRFKYLSDGTELGWSMLEKDQGPELCVMTQTIKYDKENGVKCFKDVWNAFLCKRFGQVICQEKP